MHNMFNLTKYQRDHTCRKRTCLLPSVAHVMFHFKGWSCSKNEVSGCSERCDAGRKAILRASHGTTGAAGHRKRLMSRKADCCPLPKRIIKLNVSILQSNRQQSPQTGLPQLAPWHHVGATMDITRDLWRDPSGTESLNILNMHLDQ